jgi:putative iron-dependent peroxidase
VALTGADRHGGAQRQILRDKMPFGSAGRGEFGTYFVGYAATPGVIEQMLASMFIGDPPGNYDRILDFSAAVTGGMFFVPSADFLRDPPGPPGLPVRTPVAWEPATPEPATPEPATPEPAAREPDLADVSAPPGIPRPPGPAEHVGGLTRSGPAVTIPPRV